MNFEINLIFLIKPFFLHGLKAKTKIWTSWEPKEIKKNFHRFQKAIIEAYKTIFFEGESPILNIHKIFLIADVR